MTAAASIIANHNPLSIQKSYAEYEEEIKQLTACAWQIAYTALWNTQQFTPEETAAAKTCISNFLQQQPGHKMQYTAFVQRVLLARQYISSHPGTYIPVPTQWFNSQNKNGFAGTQNWLAAVQKTRASMPLYKQAIGNFPEAVWQTIQTGKPTCFHYWRSYFIQQKANGLLNLYLSTLANCYNSIK
jgi:hypothetical protein